MYRYINIAKRWLRDLRIIFMYRIKISEREGYQNEVDIDYSLSKRFTINNESQRSIAFAFTTIKNQTDGKLLWIDELLKVTRIKVKALALICCVKLLKMPSLRDLPVALFVDPGGVGGKRFNQEELTNWYAKYGFVKEGGMMILRP
ncbi:MAG: hypothetical protein AAF630_10360 [Cyanobacteria bacterium P01_C01_bin.38]